MIVTWTDEYALNYGGGEEPRVGLTMRNAFEISKREREKYKTMHNVHRR